MQHDPSSPAASINPTAAQSTERLHTSLEDTKATAKSAAHDAADLIKTSGAEAKGKATETIDTASDGAAKAILQVAEQLKGAADGLQEDQPWAGKAFQTGADGLERVSTYLSTGNFSDFSGDIQGFARSNPAAFLGISVALGILVARVGKVAVHHAQDASAGDAPSPEPVASGGSDAVAMSTFAETI